MILTRLAALSRRERALLALLAIAVLPLAAVFGLALPLADARATARQERAEAAALRAWVEDQHAVFVARAAVRPQITGSAAGPIGISGIERRLLEAGLRESATRLTEAGDGTVTLGFDAVSFLALAEWLEQTRSGWGYEITAFSLTRGEEPDLVAAEFTLVPVP